MRIRTSIPVLIAMGLAFGLATTADTQTMKDDASLDARQQSIVTISAFTASGELERLKPALNEGLDSGLTVNEIKEILVQMYAYAGFPRSLNGMATFMEVLGERKAKGVTDKVGRDASPVPPDRDRDAYGARVRADLSGLEEIPPPAAWQKFSPVVDDFLKQHLFADIFARDVLTRQERELATIAALANMSGTAGQLAFHLGAAMHTGLTITQMNGFIETLGAKVDGRRAEAAQMVLSEVLAKRKL
ncbi:carboxymuconolactone decarboxylase family protein [Fundidesulfovibrio butyratiphilus]